MSSEKSSSEKRPGEPPEIGAIYVGLGESTGDEGIVAAITHLGPTPMVFSNRATLDKVGFIAQAVADSTGEVVRFVEFKRVGVVAEYRPRVRPAPGDTPEGPPGVPPWG